MHDGWMRLKLATLMLLTGMTMGMEPRKEPKVYTPEEVENSTAYPNAPLARLISVAVPPTSPAADPTMPKDRRKKMEEQVRAVSNLFGVNITEPIELTKHRKNSAAHRGKDGTFLMLDFDDKNEIIQFYLTGSDLPDDGVHMTTPELFEGYARECHRKAFGVLPVGKMDFEWDGSGIKVRRGEAARWNVSIGGVPMKKTASVTASMDGRGQWSLSCVKGPTAAEEEALTRILQTQPTRITEEEAVATAWKNWKNVRAAPFTGPDFTIRCGLREVTEEEKEPWGENLPVNTERKAWKNQILESSEMEPVFYEVSIARTLFQINVLVDRHTGQVLRMNQGRMSW